MKLNVTDRCDACCAQAWLAAVVNGSTLMYCGTHARKFEERLFVIATEWYDYRDQILGVPEHAETTDA